jgi:DNA-binding NtrC family response regulator
MGAPLRLAEEEGHEAQSALTLEEGLGLIRSGRYNIELIERRYIAKLMSHCGSDIDRACKVSGLKRARLYQLIKKYS